MPGRFNFLPNIYVPITKSPVGCLTTDFAYVRHQLKLCPLKPYELSGYQT
jgi:hypothetical protein